MRRIAFLLAMLTAVGQAQVPQGAGLVTVESRNDFDGTVSRLAAAIADAGLARVAVIDHAENAQGAGLELPPTRLFVFGNPAVGTPLMQDSRTAALDLPQKILVWEAEDGRVFLTYNDPAYLAQRHGLDPEHEAVRKVAAALEGLLQKAASEQQP